MRKRSFFLTVLLLSFFAILEGQASQVLVINGEVVEKVVTKLTFDGDNVTLTFADSTTQTADMDAVSMQFTDVLAIRDIMAFQLKKTIDNQIDLSGLTPGTEVFIFDAAGKQVIRSKASLINVRSLKSGIYVLKAGNQIVKFVKR